MCPLYIMSPLMLMQGLTSDVAHRKLSCGIFPLPQLELLSKHAKQKAHGASQERTGPQNFVTLLMKFKYCYDLNEFPPTQIIVRNLIPEFVC